MKPIISLCIDLTSRCNLHCAGCPMGRREIFTSNGAMTPQLLRDILIKAKSEAHILGVWLYNWTEPFMHPALPSMVDQVHQSGLLCYLSSNLNISRQIPEVMGLDPEMLMVSVSGFTQGVYGIAHQGGNVEQVKANMRLVSECRRSTHVRVHWHQYRHNAGEESLMRQYAEGLGFDFCAYKAVCLPLEKAVKVWRHNEAEDKSTMQLLLPLSRAKTLCWYRRHWPCDIMNHMIIIDSDGQLRSCSAYYNARLVKRGMFLDTPMSTHLSERRQSDMCRKCMEIGAHVYCCSKSEVPLYSPVQTLIRAWRELPFHGLFPKGAARLRRLLFQ